jgi:hypothetical protein
MFFKIIIHFALFLYLTFVFIYISSPQKHNQVKYIKMDIKFGCQEVRIANMRGKHSFI